MRVKRSICINADLNLNKGAVWRDFLDSLGKAIKEDRYVRLMEDNYNQLSEDIHSLPADGTIQEVITEVNEPVWTDLKNEILLNLPRLRLTIKLSSL